MQTVLITGVGRGIGRALAHVFLEERFFVVGTSTTGAVDFEHQNLSILQLNLSSRESIEACASAVRSLRRNVDILINNAGVLLDEDETVLLPEKLRATLEVNLIGTADFTERLLGSIAARGHIIFISSTAGSLELVSEYPGGSYSHFPLHYPAYKISKAALNMYMRTLATRLKGQNDIIVSAVHPGWVKTEMGGSEANISPKEAALIIYQFARSSPETGFFWFKGEKLPW